MCRDVLNRSTDECSLDVAGCVLLPPAGPVSAPQAVRPAGGHHTGQALQDIDGSMPVYCPNTSDPADCVSVWRGALSGDATTGALQETGEGLAADVRSRENRDGQPHETDVGTSSEDHGGATHSEKEPET